MTIPYLGRVTPIQIVMLRFAGWHFDGRSKPRLLRSDARLLQEMRTTRPALCRMTKRDFGYDLAAWHTFLKRDAGYRHIYGRATVYDKIERVIADPRRKRLEALLCAEERQSSAVPTAADSSRPVAPPPASQRRKSVDGLRLTSRVKQRLFQRGVKTLGQLERISDGELLALPGIGPITVSRLRTQLREHGLNQR